jgi:hypothetical protein
MLLFAIEHRESMNEVILCLLLLSARFLDNVKELIEFKRCLPVWKRQYLRLLFILCFLHQWYITKIDFFGNVGGRLVGRLDPFLCM